MKERGLMELIALPELNPGTGENQKVVWAKFSTLSWTVFVMSAIVLQRQSAHI
jgi:hypothetical protein